jgi:hypothetical protein
MRALTVDKLLQDVPPRLRYGALAAAGVLVGLLAILLVASGGSDGPPETAAPATTEATSTERPLRVTELSSTQTPSPTPSPTPEAQTPTPAPSPEPTPEPPPPFTPTQGIVAMAATTYAGPSAATQAVGQLYQGAPVTLVGAVYGQNWIIGDQDWVPVAQPWEHTWYILDDGSYIYRAFVYLPDGPSPFGGSADHYVIVDVNAQFAYAMDGSDVVREIPITSGKPGFGTPIGNFSVIGRVQNERMTSERAGITGVAEQYDVQHVLYTQYFADGGFALHLNYWQPLGVYGSYPTSHGCVGIPLEDAQFLWLFGGAGMRVIVRDGGGAAPVPAPPPPPLPTPPTTVPTQAATPSTTAAPTSTPAATPAETSTPVVTPTAQPSPTRTPTPQAARLDETHDIV